MNYLVWLILFIVIIFIYFISRISIEHFNNLDSRIALYDSPRKCPFDYLRMYEDSSHNNEFVVESKIKNKSKEFDNIYDTIDGYQDAWNQLKHTFPNVTLCGDPYAKYIEDTRKYYSNLKNVDNTHETTIPYYENESFTGSIRVDLPSSNTPQNVIIRQLTRTVNNSSQLGTDRYMYKNSPNTNGNEQIDTSVIPANDKIPATFTDYNMQALKNQIVYDNFEREKLMQKQVYQMKEESDQLRREIELLRGKGNPGSSSAPSCFVVN